MKIVHEIEWKHGDAVGGRVLVAGKPYLHAVKERPHYTGARVEVEIFTTASNDVVQLEGSLHDVREALREAVETLDTLDECLREEVEEEAKTACQCRDCGSWVVAPKPGHPDGKGGTCLGGDDA